MRFANPELLLLILIIPFLVWWKRRGEVSLPFSSLVFVKGYNSLTSRLKVVIEHLWVVALVLLIIACARPQLPEGVAEGGEKGLEMVLAIDTSASMKSLKAGRSKLAVVKEVAKEFISGRKMDRIGLVAFAGDAIMVCPLTDDYELLKGFVDELNFGLLPSGTAIGTAIAVSINLLKDSRTESSRLIILLSDGVNNSGDIQPMDSASIARTMGIRVYTIEEGRTIDHLLERAQGDYGVNVDLLRDIAKLTGGEHFKIPSPKELLVVYEEIDRLEKERLERESYTYRDVYHLPALTALGLIMCETILLNMRFRRI